MTDNEAYSLGYDDGQKRVIPWPPAKDGRLYDFYYRGYTDGRRAAT